MDLVHHYVADGRQIPISRKPPEENPRGAVREPRVLCRGGVEANVVTDPGAPGGRGAFVSATTSEREQCNAALWHCFRSWKRQSRPPASRRGLAALDGDTFRDGDRGDPARLRADDVRDGSLTLAKLRLEDILWHLCDRSKQVATWKLY